MRFFLVAFSFFLVFPMTSMAQNPADFVLHNAQIYTVDDENPTAEALAVRDGRLLMVGAESDVLAAYPNARRVDAKGHTVVPGLIDAHAHLMGLGQSLIQADLVGTPSTAAILDTLTAYAEKLPDGAWLQGRGWDQNDWPDTDFPTRQDLDQAFPDRPVALERIDGHATWVNTAAIEATVGMDSLREMENPEGGTIRRDADGEPTGVLIDAASQIVRSEIPEPPPAELDRALREALEATAENGLTGVHDAGAPLQTIERYQRFIDEGEFPLRVYAMIGGRGDTFDHFCERGPMPDYEGRLSVRSVKFYMDGALGSRGAALLQDYSDDPGNRGLLMKEPAVLDRDVLDAVRCGFQVNTHAIGDRANRLVLDAYENAVDSLGEAVGRHRIEHAQILHPDDVDRFAELDVIASVQPTHATSDMPWADERLGQERLQTAYAWKTLNESGARLAFGSDFPVEDVDPLEGIYAAVARQDAEGSPEGGWLPQERVSRETALRGFTIDAAYAAFQEDELGSLEPGKRADFVILSKDIMEVPAPQILETDVLATYLGGEPIYEHDTWE
jgi:predicted amidohydrolase YtcJ